MGRRCRRLGAAAVVSRPGAIAHAALRLCAVAVACLLGAAAPRAETGAAATLELIPSTIATATAVETEDIGARLRLRAPAGATLGDIRLSSFSNDGIAVTVEGGAAAAELASLAADDEHLWILQLKPTRPLAKAAHVVFEVVMNEHRQGKSPIRRYLYATLQIDAPPATAVASLVAIEIKGDDTVLSRERPGTIYVVLKNQRARDLQVTEMRWFKPDFVDLWPDRADCPRDPPPAAAAPRTLAAHGSIVVPVLVCPREQVVPGKYTLLATAHVAADGVTLGALNASQAIEIGVLGESELLNLLGVPSLLLLPGFLLLITWRILQAVRPSDGAGEFFLKPTEADFWAVAIALSLGFAFAYPWLTWLLLPGGERNYLISYGLRDLVYVYSAAIVLGILTFGLWRLQAAIRAKLAAAELARTVPVAGDGEVDIVQKLAAAGGAIDLPLAHLKNTAADQALFILSPWSSAETLWLAPPMRITIKDRFDKPEDQRDAYNALERITTDGDVDAAAAQSILSDGLARGWWNVAWSTVGAVNGPVQKKPDDIERLNRRRRLVEESP
ncbi:MAG: hypothetical protein GY791_00435 [Alphaproteobacteria bacterium]|nr:hypothetical protein [Alphaproteobacteria bacterium]